jgi:branched-chain amino acid transport system substrate-binding protein
VARVLNWDKTTCFAGSISVDEHGLDIGKGRKQGGRQNANQEGDRPVKPRHFVAIVLAILIVTALLAAGCGSASVSTTDGAGPSGEPIKVGVIYSATGVAAAPSKELVDTLKLELKALNVAGGIDGRPIEFVMADDGSDAQKGVVAATKLIQDDKVTAILGPFAMFISSAVGMLAEKSQMPIIYLSPKSPGDTATQKWVFAIDYTVSQQMAMTLELVKAAGAKKWVAFAENLPGSAMGMKQLAKDATEAGISFTYYSDTWDITEMDVSGVVTKIAAAAKQDGVDALYIGMNAYQAPYICKGLRDLGITAPIFTTANSGAQSLFSLGSAPVEGLTMLGKALMDPAALPDSAVTKQNAIAFIARYKQEYGEDPGLWSALGYDAFAVLVDALKRGGTDATGLRDAIESTKDLVALGGVYTFGPDIHGGASGGMFQFAVRDGRFVYVKTVE